MQTILTELNLVATSLNVVGALNQRLTNQIDYNSSISDALTTGLRALVDADLPAESARLQSQQIKQQLATQSRSIANQGPAVLLSLFRYTLRTFRRRQPFGLPSFFVLSDS